MSHDLTHAGRKTQTIHAGQYSDPTTGALSAPIYQSSTFAFTDCAQGAARFAGKEGGHIYTRMGNPTTDRLEEAIATLEGGSGAVTTSSGMGALCAVIFGLLGAGDHVVGHSSLYGPSRMVIEADFKRFGVDSTFVDTSDLELVKAALRPNTRLILIETPANPTIVLSDIRALAAIAEEQGAWLLVDNTFASPVNQRPLEYGAHIVMHSMTKFINGHTDVVAGVVVTKDAELLGKIAHAHHYLGVNMDPHQAWLVLRGLKTLSLRMRESERNAQRVAEFLEQHPKVEWVRYPGLKSHPQHELATSQMDGYGGLISFEVKGGLEAGVRLLDNVNLMTLAVSLGGIETLIQHPGSMTHAAIPREERLEAGITDGLVRVSIGCEDVEDLLADFEQALAQV
jgi:methionine-gamma-lyase